MQKRTENGAGHSNQQRPILFVGGGPGDPELITVKGRKALMAADVIVYTGSLVPRVLLGWSRPGAVAIDSAGMHLDQIIACLVEHQAAGKAVVRLHTGDPSLYSAMAEQLAALRERAIPFGVIPGVTAAFAAASALEIEYTLPEVCQTLIVTRLPGRTPMPAGESLESLAAHGCSLAIYLSAGMAAQAAAVLQRALGPQAPCAVVCRASQPDQQIVRTTAGELARAVAAAGITRQAVILAGPALDRAADSTGHASRLYARGFSHGYRKAPSHETRS